MYQTWGYPKSSLSPEEEDLIFNFIWLFRDFFHLLSDLYFWSNQGNISLISCHVLPLDVLYLVDTSEVVSIFQVKNYTVLCSLFHLLGVVSMRLWKSYSLNLCKVTEVEHVYWYEWLQRVDIFHISVRLYRRGIHIVVV